MSSLIPPFRSAEVWIDFDGTITQLDVLDELIKHFAVDESWKAVELDWQRGLIGSRECLTRQLATVRIFEPDLDAFLSTIPLDPGVVTLVNLLGRVGVPVTILSDGIDRFIGRLMTRAGLGRVPYRSNAIELVDSSIRLRCPFSSVDCRSGSAHCKCDSIGELTAGRTGIYIGDGRSDLCPSRTIPCRFAKGVLAANLEREGLAYLPFSTLDEVASIIATAWGVDLTPSA